MNLASVLVRQIFLVILYLVQNQVNAQLFSDDFLRNKNKVDSIPLGGESLKQWEKEQRLLLTKEYLKDLELSKGLIIHGRSYQASNILTNWQIPYKIPYQKQLQHKYLNTLLWLNFVNGDFKQVEIILDKLKNTLSILKYQLHYCRIDLIINVINSSDLHKDSAFLINKANECLVNTNSVYRDELDWLFYFKEIFLNPNDKEMIKDFYLNIAPLKSYPSQKINDLIDFYTETNSDLLNTKIRQIPGEQLTLEVMEKLVISLWNDRNFYKSYIKLPSNSYLKYLIEYEVSKYLNNFKDQKNALNSLLNNYPTSISFLRKIVSLEINNTNNYLDLKDTQSIEHLYESSRRDNDWKKEDNNLYELLYKTKRIFNKEEIKVAHIETSNKTNYLLKNKLSIINKLLKLKSSNEKNEKSELLKDLENACIQSDETSCQFLMTYKINPSIFYDSPSSENTHQFSHKPINWDLKQLPYSQKELELREVRMGLLPLVTE